VRGVTLTMSTLSNRTINGRGVGLGLGLGCGFGVGWGFGGGNLGLFGLGLGGGCGFGIGIGWGIGVGWGSKYINQNFLFKETTHSRRTKVESEKLCTARRENL